MGIEAGVLINRDRLGSYLSNGDGQISKDFPFSKPTVSIPPPLMFLNKRCPESDNCKDFACGLISRDMIVLYRDE